VEPSPLADAFRPIIEVRRIAAELLAEPGRWLEYHVALSLCALRVTSWTNRSLAARRLGYLVSALAMGAARDRAQPHTAGDLTEVTTDLT
jgi:hypothetical protein